jgi:uncharacterized protein (TIGR02145 family)
MKTEPCKLRLIAAICIAMVFPTGCEKEETYDDGNATSYGTLKDIDGTIYQTINIGQQEWMAENLKVTKYNDGQKIRQYSNPGEISIIEDISDKGRYGIYPHEQIEGIESDADVVKAYGLHYNWYAVESKKLCPSGWRVPRLDDWEELFGYLIDNYDYIDNWFDVGATLKSCRQADSPMKGDCNTSEHPRWNPDGVNYWLIDMQQTHPDYEYPIPDTEFIWPLAGTNELGFSALPAGKYSTNQYHGIFGSHGVGYLSAFWVDHKEKMETTWIPEIPEGEGTNVIIMDEMIYNVELKHGLGISGSSNNNYAYSVRCIR